MVRSNIHISQRRNTQTVRAECNGTYMNCWRFGTRSFIYSFALACANSGTRPSFQFTSVTTCYHKKRKFSKATKLATTHEASYGQGW